MPGFDFLVSERIEVAWGAVPRTSREREVLFHPPDVDIDVTGAIEASVYSLPSAFFAFDEAAAFLRAVHDTAPERLLLVLSDFPLIKQLRSLSADIRLELIDTHGRDYSAWPRDPFTLRRNDDLSVTIVVRPNLQAEREADVFMGRELVQGLPPTVDSDWGSTTWAVAEVPFHNGNMLLTPGVTWISVHTVQNRTLELLRQYELAPEDLNRPGAVEKYVAAARAAAAELGPLYGQPTRFVHPLPFVDGDAFTRFLLDQSAVRDLDSLLTFLLGPGGELTALVGDIDAGTSLVRASNPKDWELVRETYSLWPDARELRTLMLAEQESPPVRRLDEFLELVALHLQQQGITVERLPLLQVGGDMLSDVVRLDGRGFMLTWNNVVTERTASTARAEGFATGFAPGDEVARRAFEAAGYELDLLPPLAMSVVRDGGYRCASNHLRAPSADLVLEGDNR